MTPTPPLPLDARPPAPRADALATTLFALDAHLADAARAAAEQLEAIGAARARLTELRRALPWAMWPGDTE